MTIIKTLLKWTLAVFIISTPATAIAQDRCGLRTISGGTASVSYDPFRGTSTGVTLSGVILERTNGPGGEKTQTINFYVRGVSAAQNGTSLLVSTGTTTGNGGGAGFNQNIFANVTGPFPPLSNTSSPPPGVFYWNFNGNNTQSDRFTLGMNMTLPPNLNLTASSTLSFDIVYSCSGNGGGGPFVDTGVVTGAIVVNVTVLSALQASYVGNATGLDFGEVGDVTTAQVLGAPGTYTTPTTNYVRVASSGPYSVTMTSQNGYRLTFPGGNLANVNQRLDYRVLFLGQTRSNASPTFTTVNCVRAGIDAAAGTLPIRATLLEGGLGTGTPKAPSPNYSDFLTVTITPLVVAGAQQSCSTL